MNTVPYGNIAALNSSNTCCPCANVELQRCLSSKNLSQVSDAPAECCQQDDIAAEHVARIDVDSSLDAINAIQIWIKIGESLDINWQVKLRKRPKRLGF